MTDQELMQAEEIGRIHNHLSAAAKWLKKLEERSGRKLSIFCETGEPHLIDEMIDRAIADGGSSLRRGFKIDRGGSVVAQLYTGSGKFDGGGW